MQDLVVIELFDFQKKYLFQLVKNISDKDLYLFQDKGFNSAGWILGNLCL